MAHALEQFFAIVGYPKILHIDNENESTATEILQILKSINPNILSVTGCARRPSDQGSVENIKRAIEDEICIADGKLNWVAVLPRVVIGINSGEGKVSRNTSAYKSLFGMPYHDSFDGTMKELRACKTIEQRLKMFPDPQLRKSAEELCILRDDNERLGRWEWDPSSDDEDEGKSVDDV